MAQFLDAALAYARRGWFVFPLRPNSKVPYLRGGHHNASRDATKIMEWWRDTPDANIGIALAPSKLLVLDVDGPEGRKSFHDYVRPALGDADTLAQRTRSNGFHLFYNAGDAPAYRNISQTWNKIDVLSDGYVVAAPSKIAPDEKFPHWGSYTLINPDHPTVAPPRVLVEAQRALAHKVATVESKSIGRSTGIVPDGQRNTTLFRVACQFVNAGCDSDETLAALTRYNTTHCRPPLPDTEIAQLVRQAHAHAENQQLDVIGYQALVDRKRASVGLPPMSATEMLAAPAEDPAAPLEGFAAELAACAIGMNTSQPLEQVTWIPTPFGPLNRTLGGGLPVRRLSTIIAPPASGKTGIALQIALAAAEAGTPVLYFSSEIEADEIAARLCALKGGDTWRDIISGKAPDTRAELLAHLPLWIVPPERLAPHRKSVDDVRQYIARLVDLVSTDPKNPPLVIVDYLQNMISRTDAESATVSVNALSSELLTIARVFGVAMLAISSTSRDNYGKNVQALRARTDPSEFLGAAKGAGDVEFDSSNVLFLDVDSTIHAHADDARGFRWARCLVAKARYGEPAAIGLRFHGARGTFVPDATAIAALAVPDEKPSRKEKPDARTLWPDVQQFLQRNGPRTQKQILDALECPLSDLEKTLTIALRGGELYKQRQLNPHSPPITLFQLERPKP